MRLPLLIHTAMLLSFFGYAGAAENLIQPLEEGRELAENVSRDLWRFDIHGGKDNLVISTFRVEPDEKLSTNGLPKAYSIQTIHYVPSGQKSESVAVTRVIAGTRITKDDPVYRSIDIRGFGHALTLRGLEDIGGHQHAVNADVLSIKNVATAASKTFHFADSATAPTKRLTVTLSLKAVLSKKDARWNMFLQRQMECPEMGEHPWSVTLPPVPVASTPPIQGGAETVDGRAVAVPKYPAALQITIQKPGPSGLIVRCDMDQASGDIKCGPKDSRTKLSWTFVEHRDDKDYYKVLWEYTGAGHSSNSKELMAKFDGSNETKLIDSEHSIVMIKGPLPLITGTKEK